MALGLKQFKRILAEYQQNPLCADQLVDFMADAGVRGSRNLQIAIDQELAKAAANDDPAVAPDFSPGNFTRIDPFLLSPGGVLLNGGYFGKAVFADTFACKIDESLKFGPLDMDPFKSAFARVRDGEATCAICDFRFGQAVFVPAPSKDAPEPGERPGAIVACFFMKDSGDARRDRVSNVHPIALGRVIQMFDPTRARKASEWMMAPPDRRVFKLRDGRSISTRWYGPARATPVIVFGPIHKSTMADPWLANAAIAQGLALLVIERPGLGASDPVKKTTYEGVAEDIAEIVQALSLREVHIYGAGSAASFALATAARLGDIVKAVALTAPRAGKPSRQAPSAYGKLIWGLLNSTYGLDATARLIRKMRFAGSAQSLLTAYAINNDRDRRILKSEGTLAYNVAQTNDAVHKTVQGALAEFRLYLSGAFFPPAKVSQPIRIWQGAEDKTLLLDDTKRMFADAPNAVLEVVEGAGVLMDEADVAAIMQWLAVGWKAQLPVQKRAAI